MTKLHRRRYPRQPTQHPIWIYDGPDQVPGTLLDISESGMKIDLNGRAIGGSEISVFLSADQPLYRCRIQWRAGSVIGVQLV